MKVIWKYQLLTTDNAVNMPRGAKVIHVEQQHGGVLPTLLAEVDPTAPNETRRFIVVGTGGDCSDDWQHVGSGVCGAFVWHIYEEVDDEQGSDSETKQGDAVAD